MTEPKKYTAEVLDALAGLGFKQGPPSPPAAPEGHLRYHIAVGQTQLGGTAPRSFIVTQLRELADQIEKEQ